MARGVAFDQLQRAKRVGPQCEVAEYEDQSGDKGLTLDRVVVDVVTHVVDEEITEDREEGCH